MTTRIPISDLMRESGVGFGTSGARGLVSAMNDRVCYLYTLAFLDHLRQQRQIEANSTVYIGGDLRPSTPRILRAVAQAIDDAGHTARLAGFLPTPALAHQAMCEGLPSIMVTGSHIPDDRNGIKFYRPDGEILKEDEQAIRACTPTCPESMFDKEGMLRHSRPLPPLDELARESYIQRYLDFFPADCLRGRRIGVYQHSSVTRDIYPPILRALGADVLELGRSEEFIPVDTEAIREEDIELARHWSKQHQLDAIVSADGDGDRPLIADEQGRWMRGDIAGILCARFLHAKSVVTPINSNTALEASKAFSHIRRTRIGSPYVIAAMIEVAKDKANHPVVGYEANGGFLTASRIERQGRVLSALPTRDAVIVPLAILALAGARPLSTVLRELPARFTSSGRVPNMPHAISRERIAALTQGGLATASAWIEPEFDPVVEIDTTDGLRMRLRNGEIIHLRPSGNAPELRCYNEADSQQRADAMNALCLQRLRRWKEESRGD